MHYLVLAEGYKDHLKKFEEDFNGKQYANGRAKLRVRKVELYDLVVNEEGKEEFLGDLLSLRGRIWGDRTDQPSFKWNKIIWVIRKILSPFGVQPIDFKGVKNSGWRGPESEGKHNYNAHFIPIGCVPDPHDKDGSEIV